MTVRELERLRERDHERRHTWLPGVVVAVILAVGIVSFASSSRSETPAVVDPLARLEPLLSRRTTETETRAVATTEPPTPTVDREALTYPEALVDSRPEVALALARAEAESAHLDPVVDDTPRAGSNALPTPPAPSTPAAPGPANTIEVPAAPPPAPVAATTASPRERAHVRTLATLDDPLVRAALPRGTTRATTSTGHEGAYTIQVISYETREEAASFAESLLARGHHAFLTTGEIEGRGRVHRVRIGPFSSLGEAERYRAEFERTEHMNTFVLRRAADGQAAAE